MFSSRSQKIYRLDWLVWVVLWMLNQFSHLFQIILANRKELMIQNAVPRYLMVYVDVPKLLAQYFVTAYLLTLQKIAMISGFITLCLVVISGSL